MTRKAPAFRPALIVALMGTLALTACGGGSGDSAAAGDPNDDNPVTDPGFEPDIFDDLGDDTLFFYDVSGGAVTEVIQKTFYTDFETRTGIPVRADFYTDNSTLHAGMDAGQAQWSIAQFDGAAAARSENEDILLPLDKDKIPLDLMNDDAYTDHILKPWKVGVILTWNNGSFPDGGPDTIDKFFDTDAYPGKRCLFRAAQGGGVIEAGMAAAGVGQDDMYPLDTAVAFEQLDRIKDDIIWFTSADQAQRSLKTGDCAAGIMWANRIYQSNNSDNADLGFSWNFAVTDTVYYGIPKTSPNPEAAQAYLAMVILDREAGAEMAAELALAPDLKDPIEASEDIQPYLAVESNLDSAIQSDTAWYGENISGLIDEFDAWLVE